MDTLTTVLAQFGPIIATAGGLLWSFSRQITRIEAELQSLRHQLEDCKKGNEDNRQGRLEVFGVLNGVMKPKDNELSERLARVETLQSIMSPSDMIERLAKIEASKTDEA